MVKIFRRIKNVIKNPRKIILYLNEKGFSWLFSDKFLIKCAYKTCVGKKLNLKNPQTFNEKLQWLKLYDRKPEYTTMVDKVAVKDYVAEKIGAEYIIPTLGVYEKFEDIDFKALPNQFVIKCAHDSGGLVICKDKSTFDIDKAREKIKWSQKRKYFYLHREWPYKNVKPRIIVEKYMVDDPYAEDVCLTDYKFFCFGGTPQLMYISKDRGLEPRTDFFDMEWERINIRMKDPNSEIVPTIPFQAKKMKEIAAILSKGIPHIRVDFYLISSKIYVGELTFFHNSGFGKICPEEWDYKLGSYIDLSKVKKER